MSYVVSGRDPVALGVLPLLGLEALEGRLKRDVHSPVVLHLATHGYYLGKTPEREAAGLDAGAAGLDAGAAAVCDDPVLNSGIALAGANRGLAGEPLPAEAEDGVLNGADVAMLDLAGTGLVVLSGCETGLGVVESGEGVVGLRSAFHAAGSRTLLCSLWQVHDAATSALMRTFYQALLEGESRLEALEAGRAAVAAIWPEPGLWAAFICEGETGPLALRRPPGGGERHP